MAIALVQKSTLSTSSTCTLSSTTSGNTLLVSIFYSYGGYAPIVSASGCTFTLAGAGEQGTYYVQTYYMTSIPSGVTYISFTIPSGTAYSISASEWSGITGFGNSSPNGGTSGAPIGASVSGAMVYGAAFSNASLAVGSGFTGVNTQSNGPFVFTDEYCLEASGTPVYTASSATNWAVASTGWSGTVSPSFTIASSPTSESVAAGSQTTYTVTLSPTGGYSGTVTPSVTSGLPSGATAAWSPSTLTSGGSWQSVLTISSTTGTATGTYTLNIQGTDGTITKTTSVTYIVTAAPAGGFAGRWLSH